MGQGWLETEVRFMVNGETKMLEEYAQPKAGVTLDPAIFEPAAGFRRAGSSKTPEPQGSLRERASGWLHCGTPARTVQASLSPLLLIRLP